MGLKNGPSSPFLSSESPLSPSSSSSSSCGPPNKTSMIVFCLSAMLMMCSILNISSRCSQDDAYRVIKNNVVRMGGGNNRNDGGSSTNNNLPEGLCHKNPFLTTAFNDSELAAMKPRADEWLSNFPNYRAGWYKARRVGHARFHPFNPLAQCMEDQLDCIGGPCGSDPSKNICGIRALHNISSSSDSSSSSSDSSSSCIIYSLGSNNDWGFETSMIDVIPDHCEIHTFDCTGPRSRFVKPSHSQIHFHYNCIGTEYMPANDTCLAKGQICGEMKPLSMIQRELGHDTIHFLKIDIEGYEWGVFHEWALSEKKAKAKEEETGRSVVVAKKSHDLPMQIVAEIHIRKNRPINLVNFSQEMLEIGYMSIVRDDNPKCRGCSEITFMRYAC